MFVLSYIIFLLSKQLKSDYFKNKEHLLLSLGLLTLVVILLFFKSKDLLDPIFRSYFGIEGKNRIFDFIIPIGISYYIFKLIGYFLDVYWEKIMPEKEFISFGL